MGDIPAEEIPPQEQQQQQQEHRGMPDDLLEQVLCFLPPTQALRCGRTSRAFLRAALTSLERAAWPADPGASCDYNCCRAGSNGNGDRGGRLVGTPCLDLREAGDAVDSRALLAVVGGIFSKPGGGSSNAPDGEDGDQGESGKSAAARKPAVLKGLAVRSADVQDEAIRLALRLHGEGLEALHLAGCAGLDSSFTMTAIRQYCKRLVALDLSGPSGDGLGGAGEAGAPPEAGAFAGRRGPGYGLFQNHSRRLPLVSGLSSLLSTIGGGLLVLRLRDRPDISDEEVRVIAEGCDQLRELDIGTRTGRLSDVTGHITGQGLDYLYQAPCADSLVCLGLRNQPAIGRPDLRALGSRLPRLRRLDLAGLVKVDDEVLEALASTLSLSHVDLSRTHHVSEAGVSTLAAASPDLECVSLHGIIGLADGAVRALCDGCPRLRHVNVSMTRVTERGLRLLAVKESLRWANIRCCPCLFDDTPTRKVLAAFRYRLSMPKHPRDRGTVLGMERPQTQLRARPPGRSPHRPHGGSGSRCQGPADDRARTEGLGIGGGLECRLGVSFGGGRAAHRDDALLPSGTDGSGGGDGGGGDSAAGVKAAAAEGAGESKVSPSREAASPAAGTEKGPEGGGGASVKEGKSHARVREQAHEDEHPPAHAHAHATPAATMSAAEAPAPTTALRSGGLAAPAAAPAATLAPGPASSPPRRADPPPLPLLPAGVGNLSLGQHRRRVGSQRRAPSSSSLKAIGTTASWDLGDPMRGKQRPGDDGRRFSRAGGVDDRERGGGGEDSVENEEAPGVVVPFDWDTVPRGSVGVLGAWRGFRGLSGDLVQKVVQELHPYAQVEFRAESSSLLGPPVRKNNHGYLVHTSRWGQAWVEFEVDERGCVA